jgi:hypothetical protein
VLKVLFVGNSFTFANDMPRQLADLVAPDGTCGPIEFTQITPPGETLQGHWNTPSTITTLRNRTWDYVVLQEQSTRSFENPELFFQYARLWGQVIRDIGTEPLFFVTWARRDQPEKQAAITAAYTAAAGEMQARLAPVGPAWQVALRAMPSLLLHEADGSHPTPSGSYLTACVLFATLLSKSPEGSSNNYGLADAETRFLQNIAAQTVKEFAQRSPSE